MPRRSPRACRWSLLAALAGCAAHDPPPEPEPTRAPTRVEALARVLDFEFAGARGPDPLTGRAAVWVGRAEIAVVTADGGLTRHVERLEDGAFRRTREQSPPDLAPALGPEFAAYDSVAPAVDVFIDRRVPTRTLEWVVRALWNAGAREYHLVGGTADAPGSVRFEVWPSVPEPMREPPPLRDIRVDLALTWDERGAHAVGLPRPAENMPLESGVFESPPDDGAPPWFRERVPLLVAAGDPPLTPAAVAQLTVDLCAHNGAPYAVRIEATPELAYGDLLAAVVASVPAPRCRAHHSLALPEARLGALVPLADIKRHVLAGPPADTSASP